MQRFACWFDIGFGAADVQHSCLGSGVEGSWEGTDEPKPYT